MHRPGPHAVALTLLMALLMIASPVAAQIGGELGSGGPFEPRAPSEDPKYPRGEKPCPNAHPDWRNETTVFGVHVQASDQCQPDNPKLVAAVTRGTDEIPEDELNSLALHEDAVTKCCDRDGDGDPDVINVTLEASEINGWHLEKDVLADPFEIAPGIHPTFWVFNPKTTVHHSGEAFRDLVRMPSMPMRFEVGDTVRLTLENTHYFPHTIHLHGFDHPFVDEEGEGNDGVPFISEAPVRPGEARTYEFTPREPGTQFYHCHVQPNIHVNMGLSTIAIIEENRANNTLQTFNPGGGEVRHPSQASRENYDREFDMVYQAIYKELNQIPKTSNDPRVIAERMNRQFDITEAKADYFLLNGRSFPYTMRESAVTVDQDEEVLMRVINAGSKPVSLHTHGHKGTIVERDGVPDPAPVQRDTYTITAAQRLDIKLTTTDDGLHNYGPGIWFMHDHQEEAITTDGIAPGGDSTVIVYQQYLNENTSFPEVQGGELDVLFTEEYWRGEIPVWRDLGLPSFLGQIARTSTVEQEAPQNPIPGLGTTAATVGILAALGAARLVRGGEDR